MLNQGRWVGSVMEAQFCVDAGGCIVFPREVAVIEQIAVCGQPIAIENGWYQFTRLLANMEQCAGCSTSCGNQNICQCGHLAMRERRGEAVSFATTIGANKVIRCYPTNAADVGKTLVFQGRDANGIWVRTTIGGVVADGEEVALALPHVDTTTVWGAGAPAAVVKEATDYRVLVYEHDTVTGLERALAEYEPGETRPGYRVGYVPGMANVSCCGCDCTAEALRTITAMVSLRSVPLTAPGDWLVLQNLPAYKAAMIAVKAWEDGDVARGDFYFYGTSAASRNARGTLRVVNRGGAIPLLQAELRKYTADRVNAFIYTDESNKLVRQMAGFI